ncbi:MAG: hypothetical protein HOO00_07470 [Rhodospirillaceae bacterium]|jgi:chemotaxis protein CheZ|nr:hypothetical protein [Rhodospirillaceae bacterium]MBT5373470.1 hypothetical protein [Rhodospirillaceae bacterium]MBT5752442.1 hypothetical protein [Rhodospirillaceae bacterium]
MSGHQAKKEFSIERNMRAVGIEPSSVFASAQAPLDGESVSNAELLEALNALGNQVDSLKASLSDLPAQQSAPQESMHSETIEDENLAKDVRVEIAQMVRSIGAAKREISQIKHPMSDDDQILRASSELDAIVEATEVATNGILEASEEIDGLLKELESKYSAEEDLVDGCEKIANLVIGIMEHCNFQDITGQRVTKVVKTMRFIEDRILAMIGIWGVDAFSDLPVEAEGEAEGDGEDIMHGPQLANEGISQDDIDALFD